MRSVFGSLQTEPGASPALDGAQRLNRAQQAPAAVFRLLTTKEVLPLLRERICACAHWRDTGSPGADPSPAGRGLGRWAPWVSRFLSRCPPASVHQTTLRLSGVAPLGG